MNGMHRLVVAVSVAACALAVAGCTASAPPAPAPAPTPTPNPATSPPAQAEPAALFDEIKAAGYTSWKPAPGYETLQPAKGPHGEEVQVFLDPAAEKGLADGGAQWPMDAVIVKDIYQGGELIQIAAMKKTADGWYWGEWTAQGEPVAEGLAIEPCQSCHASGTDGTLSVQLK